MPTSPHNEIYNKLVTASAPVFTSYGRDIMLSDIVKTAIHRVAEEVSKCSFKSVVEKQNPHTVKVVDDEINTLFSGRINPLMTLKDFLYKVAFLTLRNCNCFIYPQFVEVPIGNGKIRRIYKAFYPIENIKKISIYNNGIEMRIKLENNVAIFDMPYADIIHIRHKYSENAYLGGNKTGQLKLVSYWKIYKQYTSSKSVFLNHLSHHFL